MSGRRDSERRFDVWPTREAERDLSALRGRQVKAFRAARQELERVGCAAAHYRLSGEGVDHICVRKLADNWRVVLCFPADNEVAILLVGPHERENPKLDVYRRLYEALGLDVPDDEHRRPPCCADGQPPIEPQLLERAASLAR